jgi:hypothetical protein
MRIALVNISILRVINVLPKCQHGVVISQITAFFIVTAVKTSKDLSTVVVYREDNQRHIRQRNSFSTISSRYQIDTAMMIPLQEALFPVRRCEPRWLRGFQPEDARGHILPERQQESSNSRDKILHLEILTDAPVFKSSSIIFNV